MPQQQHHTLPALDEQPQSIITQGWEQEVLPSCQLTMKPGGSGDDWRVHTWDREDSLFSSSSLSTRDMGPRGYL